MILLCVEAKLSNYIHVVCLDLLMISVKIVSPGLIIFHKFMY